MKIKLGAVIPTVQYGNLEPEFELDLPADGMSEEDGMALLESKIQAIWDKYGEKPLTANDGGFVELTSFTGERVLWNKEDHICKSLDGKILLGGSTYAKKFEKPFDAEKISEQCQKAWGVKKSDLLEIWGMNSSTSTMLGDSIHNALEAVHKYWEQGELIKSKKKWKEGETPTNGALPKQPIIRKAVERYIKQFGIKGIPEVLVTDVKHGMYGWIDSLHILANNEDHKICDLEDYKTSVTDDDKLTVYNHQMSWYGQILINKGWTVRNLLLRDYDGDKWNSTEQKMLEVKL